MKKVMKRSKGRSVSSKSAKGKRPAAAKAVRRPKAAAVKAKRKATPAKPKPKAVAAAAKGPSVTTLQRRIQALEEQLRARAQDGVEVARWKQYHSQLQEQVKAKDSMLAFKDKELLELRRQREELNAQLKKKDK
jgi:small-conductance mechanosensitive channel